MPYLNFITDENLISAVKGVLDKAKAAKSLVAKNFHANVIDPFGALFEAGGFKLTHAEWLKNEEIRQAQKTLQNHVGTFHQNILGSVDGWTNLNVGENIDLTCESKKIIAEIKNKHNTVTGAKLINDYQSLNDLIMPNASKYKGYTAYFVTIIPKTPKPIDKPFTPSNKATASRCPSNEKIRIIDGASFYDLVTGEENSLASLYSVLPNVIDFLYKEYYKEEPFVVAEMDDFAKHFTQAFGQVTMTKV